MANPRRRFAPSLFVPAVALFALAGGIALLLWAWPRISRPPLERIRRAALALSARPTAGRLSGWPHLKAKGVTRSAADSPSPPALLRLRGIAGETLMMSHDPHARAVAHLVAGDTPAAIEEFRRASGQSNDADFWNDYAVACLTRSDELDDPTLAIDAVAACDHALAINGAHAAAHFNRGLALTHLGLLIQAGAEYQQAATADPSSAWSNEALRRLHEIPTNAMDGWNKALPRIATLDPKELGALVRAYPQQARAYGEGICMTNWADATLAGDAAHAAEQLGLARRIGESLHAFSGESLLRDAVVAADRSTVAGRGETLAKAYTFYRNGRVAHSKQNDSVAEAALRHAEGLFAEVGSPMALVSHYYIGSSLFAQTRLADSEALLNALSAQQPERHGYLALAAQIGWERGLSVMVHGSASDALSIFEGSRTIFERLGEKQFGASMDSLIASYYDFVAATADAWRARRHAFETLSARGDTARFAVALTTAATIAARDGKPARAIALYGMAVDAAELGRSNALTCIAYARRSIVESEQGDEVGANRDLLKAQGWVRSMHPPEPHSQADVLLAEGIALQKRNPAAAADRLAEAAKFYEIANYRVDLPRIQLERARAERARGDIAEARKQLTVGIDILESQRSGLLDFDQRASLFAGTGQIFSEAVDAALTAGDVSAAVDIADRHCARDLLDRFSLGRQAGSVAEPLKPSEVQHALAGDSAIVEYVFLRDRVVAFVVRRDRLSAVSLEAGPDSVSEAARRLMTASDPDGLAEAGSAAYIALLKPLQSALYGIRRIAFVTPEELDGVPFAALRDPANGHFLIENTVVMESPSASLAINLSRQTAALKTPRVLALGASRFDADAYPSARALPRANEEAERVGRSYRQALVLEGEEATRERVIAALPLVDAVHFAGHAVIPMGGDAIILLAPTPFQHNVLRASEIARMPLRGVRLVVLAACRSGVGRNHDVANENLALAFIAAGVTSVVATSSNLDDDEAIRIMPRLHQLIASGTAPDEALRITLASEIQRRPDGTKGRSPWTMITMIGGSPELIDRTQRRSP